NEGVKAAEQAGLSIGGTTTPYDGQDVTVTVDGHTYHGTVASGAWSVSVTDTLSDGPHTVTADVSDAAGNPATGATRPITVDETGTGRAAGTGGGEGVGEGEQRGAV